MNRIIFLTGIVFLFGSTLYFTANGQQTKRLILFGRGTYPGDDSTCNAIRNAEFKTFILSSFYIRSNGDVYSGDDSKKPIIQNGQYTGDKEWIRRLSSLRASTGSVDRIEILLEGRWFNQAPNTYDFIRDWLDSNKTTTMRSILKVFKEVIGADAICIDDESVYDSLSIVRLSTLTGEAGMKMSLCPYTKMSFWKYIIDHATPGVVDAVYLQCYDGGGRNTPGPWVKTLGNALPVYPIFLCRGAFSTCKTDHNSKTPEEMHLAMQQYRTDYPGLPGGGVWQMEDVKSFVRMNCKVQEPLSGTAATVAEYLDQLKKSLQTTQ